jgi:hypothetical protein
MGNRSLAIAVAIVLIVAGIWFYFRTNQASQAPTAPVVTHSMPGVPH